MINRCLFCGGAAEEPDHLLRCDGRQGHRELDDRARRLPPLVAGLEPPTYRTSAAAAVSIEDLRDTQRALVLDAIRATGTAGATDDELQERLHLDGSSERPRRWELWKLNRICIKRDDTGKAVKRLTRTNRRAVVWVAA